MDRLAAMQTFVHVVESGSFSAAARLLDIGQPAVSKPSPSWRRGWRYGCCCARPAA